MCNSNIEGTKKNVIYKIGNVVNQTSSWGGSDVQKHIHFYPFPSNHRRLKQKFTYHHDCALRPAPSWLPHASLSTAPPASLPLHHCRVLVARGRTTQLLLSPPLRALCAPYCWGSRSPTTEGSAAAQRGPHSRSPTAILLLHHNRTAGSHCTMFRLLGCHVLLKAHVANIYFKCFRWTLQKYMF
jgi:hypothetical protein